MTGPRLWTLACIGLLTALGVLGPAAGAQAAAPLELSVDGRTWSTSLPVGLFTSPAAAVPGDVLISDLWVRNSSHDPARVALDVADGLGVGTGTLAADLSLHIDGTAVAGGTTWSGPELEPGSVARIGLVVTYAASSPLTSSVSVAAVLDAVTLVQTGVGRGAAPAATPVGHVRPTAGPSAPGGTLAHTGADPADAWVVALGATLGGLVLVVARRRSRTARG